ncbi:MAG: Rrf2 family transcriptional regulator [Oscillatoriales cyanobacterium SM2_2_1]|nr:Rrf2 family transcriptional regulator [Oscillatoriales cyanobacterium SM2_2_1]
MELSLKSEYAILALMELANHHQAEQPLQIRQIAQQRQIPDRYLEQLLATLKRHGLVKSQRGAKGGYLLALPPAQINLLDIVSCLEGVTEQSSGIDVKESLVRCIWRQSQEAAMEILRTCTLEALCEQERQRQLPNAMYYI